MKREPSAEGAGVPCVRGGGLWNYTGRGRGGGRGREGGFSLRTTFLYYSGSAQILNLVDSDP